MSTDAATLQGVFPMAVTPFTADGAVSERELPQIVSFVLGHGCHGVSALGMGAEVDALVFEERLRIAEVIIRAAAGAPVIVGCSSVDTELSVSLAIHAAEVGAAVVMIAPPRRPDWSRAQLLEHFSTVAAAVQPLPVMVQDAPGFIGVALDRDFVDALRTGSPNVLYAKSEAVPAAEKTAELAELGGIAVFGGHGALYCLDVLDAGAVGMIPGSEMPRAYTRIFELHQAGQHDEARRVFTQVLPLVVAQFQSLGYFIAASKTVLAERGVIERPDVRGTMPISDLGRRLLLAHARAAGAIAA
jgi:dihydrodipicolinate synthase/N-acetylneuraminate lyase